MVKKLLMVICLMASIIINAEAEILYHDETVIGFSQACSYYTYIADENMTLDAGSLKLEWKEEKGTLLSYKIEYKEEKEKVVKEKTYVIDSCKEDENETEKCKYTKEIHYSLKNTTIWNEDYEKAIEKEKAVKLRICGKFQREYIDNKWIISIDHIPIINGLRYSKFAWYNHTYDARGYMSNTPNVNISLSVNGTSGFQNVIAWINLFPYMNKFVNASVYWNITNPFDFDIVKNDSLGIKYDCENYTVNRSKPYSADAVYHFDNTDGDAYLNDSTNHDYDQINVWNGATDTDGIWDRGYSFDGNDAYELPNIIGAYTGQDYSMFIFVKSETESQSAWIVDNKLSFHKYQCQYNVSNHIKCSQKSASNTPYYCGMSNAIGTGWHMIAITYSDNENRYETYFDCVLQCNVSMDNTPKITSEKHHLGASSALAPTAYVIAEIEEYRVFNRHITKEEINALCENWYNENLVLVSTNTTITTTTTTTTTTSSTLRPCQNFTYLGEEELCFYDTNNTETCLNKEEVICYYDEDYHLELNIEKHPRRFMYIGGILQGEIFSIAYTVMILGIVIFALLYLARIL